MSAEPWTEPWTPDDDEFKMHRIFCQMCDSGGCPTGSAYRPHMLDDSCWCIRKSRRHCWLAVEYGLTEPKPESLEQDSVEIRIRQGEMAMTAIGIDLTPGAFRAAYEAAIADIRRDIALAR